ncbi:hypothetical protein [Variovorax sp. PCZ-1]|uniref:hypothetical protein n=1 Tax=Variovorax sp. PCZ-1 TaxID=2835533 RepID=UPI001BD096B5|nr:hypothetical protein [Variovorax sp. PCZ-1]MBS7808766.1 hypothetical protein [Variovorax sp. PCZ-1]
MKHPLLYLGLMGFDAASEAAARRWLTTYASQAKGGDEHPIWQVVDFREADALLIRGAGVAQGFGTHLQFSPDLQDAHPNAPLGVDLAAMKLPFAIGDTAHLQALGIDTKDSHCFNLQQDASMLKAVQHFETVLRPLRSLYSLAVELTERRQELDKDHTYHLERNGNLDAIIDVPKRRVLLRPGTRPVDICEDAWLARPRSANFAPSNFMECSLDEVGWVFATHCMDIELPKRYRSKPIHILHNPRVRSSLLYPRHAILIDQLWHHPTSFEQLQKLRTEQDDWLERDLYALYLTRCISTQQATTHDGEASSLPGDFSHTSPWMLQRLGKRMNTLAGELQSLF